MTPSQHTSALPSHYDQEAKHYDAFNEARSAHSNQLIENILRDHNAHSILDLTCGTGSQVFWLTEKGFDVVGIDINDKMLAIARKKALNKGLSLRFTQGDMRTSHIGHFDAVLTIFNAIGHLTQNDFKRALQNIHANLKEDGIYIFDIFNRTYLEHEDNITKLTIDWQKQSGDITAREIQYSTISSDGVLTSHDIYHEQKGDGAPRISTALQTLQVYSAAQLHNLLVTHGFEVLHQLDGDGALFDPNTSERIFTTARKKSAHD